MPVNIKKGDLVQVVSGKDKGRTGKVIATYAERDRVLVEGVNRVKKHTKVQQAGRGGTTGGIVTAEAAVHVSNVMLVDPKDGKPTRVGFRRDVVDKQRADGTTYQGARSLRVSRRTGEELS